MAAGDGDPVRWQHLTGQRTRVRVPMRDGVELATDIYWPQGQPLEELPARPAVLERSPYGIRRMRGSDGLHADGEPVSPESGALSFVHRGYVTVRQDCRGRGDSEGTFTKYVGEAADGYDTHRWIAAQPWCDGRILTHGVSYSAHTQTAACSVAAPNVAAMVVDSGGFSSAFEAGGRFGGAFELKQVMWAHRRAMNSPEAATDPTLAARLHGQDLGEWFRAMPWRPGFSPLAAVPDYERFVFEQWSHESLDEFWSQPGLYARGYYQNFPDVAVLNISSWYDPYVLTAVENFQELSKQKRSPMFLLLGPWTHGARSHSHAGEADFGPAATLERGLAQDYLQLKADWFDQMLRDEPSGLAPVTYFLMGGGGGRKNTEGRLEHGGAWRTAEQWPPAEAAARRLYLDHNQGLTWQPPQQPGTITYDFDPSNPVPSLGGGITSGEPLMSGGAFNQTPTDTTFGPRSTLPLSARHDVISFQTEPLVDDVLVAGPVELQLHLSSSAPDTDVTAKLIDVYPPSSDYVDGFAMNITDGMLRVRYRDGYRAPELMHPGEVYSIVVTLPDTANRFAAGHRIRLDISSSNFPRCDINPNTGNSVMGDRTRQVARNTLHTGTSHLRLVLLPE